MSTAATFGAVFCTLVAAHFLGDYVLGQTDKQAAEKAGPGWRGWRHLLGHVALYHVVMFWLLVTAVSVLHLPITLLGALAGLGLSAVTHAFIDRRWPVRWLLEHTGSADFANLRTNGMNGVHLVDQALHIGCLWVAALLIAAL